MIWNLTFHQLIDLLEWIGLTINGTEYGERIKACNLVVNVYKHGDGPAHQTLSVDHPEYYPNPTDVRGTQIVPNHDDLHVSEDQFVDFANAITAFWNAVPENCYYSDLREEPKWLDRVVTRFEKSIGAIGAD